MSAEFCLYTGKRVDPFNLNIQDLDIEDIAHALSNLCRFGGHTSKFYSVAEHSYLLSFLVPEKFALQALLHDGYEAYSCDIPDPIKKGIPGYIEAEKRALDLILQKWCGFDVLAPNVCIADKKLMLTEAELLLPRAKINSQLAPFPWHRVGIHGYLPKQAKNKFLLRFDQLKK